MKRPSTLFLKAIVALIGLLIFAWLIWFPQTEGRAQNLDLIGIYSDPFILHVYLASIPFFYGLFQAIKLLNLIDSNKAFSKAAVSTLKNIKYASILLAIFIAAAIPWIITFAKDDDSPGVVVIVAVFVLISLIITTACGVFQKLLQNAVDLKSENDLTV